MAYANFTLNQITNQFNITLDEKSRLFPNENEAVLRPEFLALRGKGDTECRFGRLPSQSRVH